MLRKRKNRRYNETNDEEGEGERKFDLLEQIKSERFDQIRDKHLQELNGEAFNLRLIQRNGFEKPILVVKPDGLHLRVPPKSFLVRDVRNCVGPQRIIDVMDVKTQKNIEMSMKDWCKYYESKNRDRLLNVISLEFSHTKLDELVDSPMIVKLLDWVDLVWPKFLKQSQTESTNSIDKMKYPKVQKYCLMSVKGSYTDFHIDFGGTSVWYHILRGRKIFWMVPPTELNLQVFEEWTLSGMQQDVFFGDTVEECFRVELCAGNTFFIPSGWIHAVYTIEDSLVFGGNFLHSFGIENQLKVSKIEDATKVPVKFRYPFYTEILWYAVQHYVYSLMNKDHLHRPTESTSSPTSAINSKQRTGVDKKATTTSNNSIEIEDKSTESEYEESDKSAKTDKKSKKASTKKTTTTSTATSKRKRQSESTKCAQKKYRKPLAGSSSSNNDTDDETEEDDDGEENDNDDDDESTDIDSANEELYSKTVEKPSANTCRMTKNSLLRLQYEIDERSVTASSSTSSLSAKKVAATKSTTANAAAKGERTSLGSGRGSLVKTSKSKSVVSPERLAPKIKPLKAQQSQQTPRQPAPAPTIAAFVNVNLADVTHESKLNGWPASLGGQNTWSSPKAAEPKEPARIHITKFEVNGLKVLVKHLSKLSGAKKNLPNLIRNSRALLDDCKKLIAEHENDDPEMAITGKPITPELLKDFHSIQKVDLNESILKISSDRTGSNGNLDGLQIQLEPTHHSATDEKSAIETGSSASQPTKPSPTTPNQKETKCLSPSKKLSNLAASSSGLAAGTNSSAIATSSPPPRPKSPPTRPLSNNQYTSKTKMNNNNLLLPGSFADLIAATSTEKKVFDVSTAEVSASLFGIKDLATSKSSSLTTSTSTTAKPSLSSPKATTKLSTSSTTPTTPISTTSTLNKSQQHDVTSATGVPSNPFAAPTAVGGGSKPISPEPPKPNIPPKRFITPMGFRPPNKEKLIYASAPYISPVHASEQRSISSQAPYPWQQQQAQQQQLHHHHHHPHHHPHNQHQSQNPPTYSPSLASQAPSNHRPSTNVHSNPISSSEQQQASYKPDSQVLNQQQHHSSPIKSSQELNYDRQQQQEEQQQQSTVKKELITAKSADCGNQSRNEDHTRGSGQVNSVIVSPNHAQHHLKTSSSNGAASSGLVDPRTKKAIVGLTTTKIETQTTNVPNEREAPQPLVGGEQTVIKKPAKPRGPPKKSKEARQVAIESAVTATSQSQETETATTSTPPARFSLPLIPISVIKGGPSGGTVPSVVPGVVRLSTQSSPASVVPATASAASGTKTKTKRAKKQKDATPTANNNATEATLTAAQQLTTMASANQARPSVICGLVRSPMPPSNLPQVQQQQQKKQQQQTVGIPVATSMQGGAGTGSGAGKLNPQSYLISRPLFPFPSMPTFSAAQFQQLQQQQHHQRPMNLLAAPIGAHPLTSLPLQQGARLVWATQPNRLMSPMPSSSQLMTTPITVPPSSTTANNPPVTQASLPKIPTTHSADNAALLSLATTALSTAPMTSSPALSHLNNRGLNPQAAIMLSSAAAAAAGQQAAAAQLFAGQQFFRPFLPMHYAALNQRPTLTTAGGILGAIATTTTGAGSITTTAATTTTGGAAAAVASQQHRPVPGQQLLLARLPNQTNQQRYLITQPGFMQHQRFQAPNIVTSQSPTSTLAYAAYKPPSATSKVIKTKKVKTS